MRCGVSLRELTDIWTIVSAWAVGFKKVPLTLTIETTGILTITVVPSVANLLLYSVHETRGWSRMWPGRDLASHSPYELYTIVLPGCRDAGSDLFGIPFEIVTYVMELYLAVVYGELFRKPYSNYNITFEKIQAIAKFVRPRSLAKHFSGTVKEVLGTAKTMGFAVDLHDPVSIQKKIDDGTYICNEDTPCILR